MEKHHTFAAGCDLLKNLYLYRVNNNHMTDVPTVIFVVIC